MIQRSPAWHPASATQSSFITTVLQSQSYTGQATFISPDEMQWCIKLSKRPLTPQMAALSKKSPIQIEMYMNQK